MLDDQRVDRPGHKHGTGRLDLRVLYSHTRAFLGVESVFPESPPDLLLKPPGRVTHSVTVRDPIPRRDHKFLSVFSVQNKCLQKKIYALALQAVAFFDVLIVETY